MSYPTEKNPQNVAFTERYQRRESHRADCGCTGCSRADGGPRSGGASGPLGIRGNSLTPPQGVAEKNKEKPQQNKAQSRHGRGRRDLKADQRRAASIYWKAVEKLTKEWEEGKVDDLSKSIKDLPGRGVTWCGKTQIPEKETRQMRQDRGEYRHSYFEGLQGCGLRWVCPICTMRKAQQDRQFVNDGLAAARESGLFPVMLTLTTRHKRREKAADVLRGIIQAEQGMKATSRWKKLCKSMKGFARVLEWTWGEKSGHHPHFHTIILMRAMSEDDAVAEVEKLRATYLRQLTKAGRDGESPAAMERSFQVQGAMEAQGYITKWGVAEEITGAMAKAADGENLTMWQLLRMARTAPARAGRTAAQERARYAAIWWDVISTTKGLAQLFKSEGFKALVHAWRETQPEPDAPSEPEEVRSYGERTKRQEASSAWMAARDCTISICEAAESAADLVSARSAVALALARGLTDADIIRAMRDDDFFDVLDDIKETEAMPTTERMNE